MRCLKIIESGSPEKIDQSDQTSSSRTETTISRKHVVLTSYLDIDRNHLKAHCDNADTMHE